ncbi:hypothetical protein FNV43_RR27350 [Rhamnella rubrinervis]|uniref:Uncharacterized protein n=1 Tax=Rhamnella rubrinervis TaxID=2594499 RepID=A0A8K0GSG2_9ROSA|nr:hypothetical protein FNV43_RR27350 [Rhamnella rubrinervis]
MVETRSTAADKNSIGLMTIGCTLAVGQGQQQAFQATVDNTGRYVPPPARLGYQDQYGHGRNDQGEIYVARLNSQNRMNDDAIGRNGRQNQLINLEPIDHLIEE